MQEAKKIGDEYLSLEKYVNLNYLVSMLQSCFCGRVLAVCCTFAVRPQLVSILRAPPDVV